MDKIAIGRTVRYVLSDGTERPAIIVETWGNIETAEHAAVQLQVFLDGMNDLIPPKTGGMKDKSYADPSPEEARAGLMWRTSVEYHEDKRPGSWHWPERV